MENNYNFGLYHFHIEISAKCTLQCPRCPRNKVENIGWKNDEWSYDEFVQAFTPEVITEHVQRFTFCGDIGDPIYCKDLLEIVEFIKQTKPTCHIYIITNGSYKKQQWWEKLASLLNEYDTINFSVDGYNQESNNLYRVNSDWDSIMMGMKIMCNQSEAFVNWAGIYFKFNQDYREKMQSLARENGCDGFQWTKSSKFGDSTDDLKPADNLVASSKRYEREVINFTNRKPPIDDYMEINERRFNEIEPVGDILPLCRIGNRGVYLSADGTLHPCSWVSAPFGSLKDERKKIKYEDSFFAKYRQHLNVKEEGLEEMVNHFAWDILTESWNKDPWVECYTKCHKRLQNYENVVQYETN